MMKNLFYLKNSLENLDNWLTNYDSFVISRCEDMEDYVYMTSVLYIDHFESILNHCRVLCDKAFDDIGDDNHAE